MSLGSLEFYFLSLCGWLLQLSFTALPAESGKQVPVVFLEGQLCNAVDVSLLPEVYQLLHCHSLTQLSVYPLKKSQC